MHIPTSLVVVAAEATVSDEDVKVGSTFRRSCFDDSVRPVCNSKEVEGGKGAIGSFDAQTFFVIYGWIDDGSGRHQCPVQLLVRWKDAGEQQ